MSSSVKNEFRTPCIGLAMRFALIFSAGASTPMKLIRLKIKDRKLILKIDKSIENLMDRRCERRLKQLAASAGLSPKIILKKSIAKM